MERLRSPAELEALRKALQDDRPADRSCLVLCSGSACQACGCREVAEAARQALEDQGLSGRVGLRLTGCHGFCERGPILVVQPEGVCYFQITPRDVPEIVEKTLVEGGRVDRLLYVDPDTGEPVPREADIPFYRHQYRLVFGANGSIDPKRIEDYIAIGGYAALAKALFEMTPEAVLDEVKRANLRGRGGGGFPAGIKWEGARDAPDPVKYVVVNADEGDPGAYMDRSLLEGNPHRVLEGLILGAYAVGAREGFVYVRQEYPLAVENITEAIRQAEAMGLLGDDILGSGFSFRVTVHRGAGAFVCGESTALMTALEGRVGEPRPKYIRSNVRGLWNRPTVLNNVETWANVPLIVQNGADWFTSLGTEGSPGTKIFSIVGKIANTGLVEVPMGMTLRDIVFKIGGGIPAGKRFKAVQTGGPSGGCLPEDMLDLPVGFDELTRAGSMMGSGGMIVMDEDTCMVDVARYFIAFLTDESCGKCTPCREGLRHMLGILERICRGQGREEDLERLEELAVVAREASLCGLGQTAPNPFLSTLRYFRGEYEAHIRERRCPALYCKDLIAFYIDPERCRACGRCRKACPVEAISGERKVIHVIDQARCTKCGTCLEVCPDRFAAVRKVSGEPVPPPPEDRRVVAEKGTAHA